MQIKALSIGLACSLLEATTFAAPLENRQVVPAQRWYAASYIGAGCGVEPFQNFTGSGSSCEVIEHGHPPAEFIVQIKSILIGSIVGRYDFTFLPGPDCAITGLDDTIYEVTSGESMCVDVSGLDPNSMNVIDIPSTVLARTASWDAEFFSGTTCEGSLAHDFTGTSSGCHLVTDLLQAPGKVAPSTGSVKISAKSGTFDFSFFQNQNCQISGLNDELYTVSGGQSQCVAYSNAVSFNVNELTYAKRSPIPEPIVAPGPESVWNLTTFPSGKCKGSSNQNFHGSGAAGCTRITGEVPSSGPISLPLALQTKSVLAQGYFGNYGYSFYGNSECIAGGTLEEVYQVQGSRCIDLSTNPESFEVFYSGLLTDA